MKRNVLRLMCGGLLVVGMTACEALRGPDKKGEIQLSSQLFGADSYYIFGYHFEDADYYRFSSRHPGIVYLCFCDGSDRPLATTIDDDTMKYLGGMGDGETPH